MTTKEIKTIENPYDDTRHYNPHDLVYINKDAITELINGLNLTETEIEAINEKLNDINVLRELTETLPEGWEEMVPTSKVILDFLTPILANINSKLGGDLIEGQEAIDIINSAEFLGSDLRAYDRLYLQWTDEHDCSEIILRNLPQGKKLNISQVLRTADNIGEWIKENYLQLQAKPDTGEAYISTTYLDFSSFGETVNNKLLSQFHYVALRKRA